MKLFKKIFVPVLAAVCLAATCAMFAACNDGETDIRAKYATEDDDTNWDYTTYIVYLQLPDGTPVEDITIYICSGTCLDDDTNEDGRMSVTFTSSRLGKEDVYAHFSGAYNATTNSYDEDVVFPEGYTFPADGTPEDGYEHTYTLTKKVTTLTLTAE